MIVILITTQNSSKLLYSFNNVLQDPFLSQGHMGLTVFLPHDGPLITPLYPTIIIIIISFIIVTCARHPADTTAYKSLIHIDIHLIISLHTKNMLPNLLTIRSTTMVISSRSSVKEHTI